MTATILILAKAPVPGRVKTRLCPPCSPEEAARIAAAALADTLDAVRAIPGVRKVIAADGELSAPEFEVIPQRGDGLGERIANAFADIGDGPVFQIGMDTPQLRPEILQDSVDALRAGEAVLGPAYDGGWWGLGLHDADRAGVLRTVPMSTSDTGELTAAALRESGLQLRLLQRLRDVDTADDARIVAREAAGSRFAGEVGALL
ncbi:MAG TPA: TIGR04282 family arsenosugar biosynthesis glycosyltransferase [Mycobacteriales bacterium]|nr:TIGR04282 family arsenosugar biosynthesis glycosyltransferase [Mycobacteriales bacterium]